jgi:ribose transport system permease protein
MPMLKIKTLGLDKFSGLYLLAIFVVVFSFWAPETFPTMSTVHLIASTQAVAGLCALALLLPMVTGHFDVSFGANASLCGMIAVILQTDRGISPIPAALFAVLVGTAVGLVNGLAVVFLRINSFVATLAMGSILGATTVIVTGNVDPIPPASAFWSKITQTQMFGFQLVVVYVMIVAVLLWWILERTAAGRSMRAAGSNPDAARLSGVRVDRWSVIALVSSGAISALAGVLFVSLSGPALSFGESLLLPAFAAVFLGTTQLIPGRPNVWGTLLSIIVLATGVQGLQLVTGVQWVAGMFNGVALLAAVALAAGRQRRALRSPSRFSWRRDAPGERSSEDTPLVLSSAG